MQTLAEYVTEVMRQKSLSGYDVERASHKAISQSSVHRTASGAVTNPGPAKLKALAKGLGVQEHELFSVARGANPDRSDLSHERLAAMNAQYERLSDEMRAKADYVIEMAAREIDRLAGQDEW